MLCLCAFSCALSRVVALQHSWTDCRVFEFQQFPHLINIKIFCAFDVQTFDNESCTCGAGCLGLLFGCESCGVCVCICVRDFTAVTVYGLAKSRLMLITP